MKNLKLFIISGGPGTGKTSIIKELSKKFKVLPESARAVGENDARFMGKSVKEINQQEFQDAIFEFQKKEIENLVKDEGEVIFSDRGLGDALAYCCVRKLKVSKKMLDYTKKFKYAGVFVLDFLDNYVRDTLRQESKEEQEKIHEMIIETYKELGYKPIIVPFMSVEERVRFILSKINNSDKK